MNRKAIVTEEYMRQKNIPGAWGTADCLTFAADCAAKLLGGRDVIASVRGRYASEIDAKRVMVEEGWKSIADFAATVFPEIPVAMAQSGDWVLIVNETGVETIGVVLGYQVVARSEAGMGISLLSKASRAFKV